MGQRRAAQSTGSTEITDIARHTVELELNGPSFGNQFMIWGTSEPLN
jgi:hypothetical protein